MNSQFQRKPLSIGTLLCCFALLVIGCTTAEPRISWLAPPPESQVWGVVLLQLSLRAQNIQEVAIYLDKIEPQSQIAASQPGDQGEFQADWFTQETSNGAHLLIAVLRTAQGQQIESALPVTVDNRSRYEFIPAEGVIIDPVSDPHPPLIALELQDQWHTPVPLGAPVNSAGAEDSAFITLDGNTLYFWFTPNPAWDVQKQAHDPYTGIYWAHRVNGDWQEPQRLFLQYHDRIGMDGAQTVWGETLWFASVRPGNFRDIDIWIAHWVNGRWWGWENAGELLNMQYQIGELHLSQDGSELYFDSRRPGGKGEKDIWVTRKVNGVWQPPEPILAVNTELNEGWPYLTSDGQQLWFTRGTPGPEIFRSWRTVDGWSEPELVVSGLAGEPSLDAAGNLYFTHFLWDEVHQRVAAADIYVAYRK